VKRSASGKSVVRDLDAEQWMAVIVPAFSAERGVGPTDTDCTGHYIFANESLRGGISQKGWPRKVDPEDIDIKAGPNGLRAVWLRTLKFENGDEGGRSPWCAPSTIAPRSSASELPRPAEVAALAGAPR